MQDQPTGIPYGYCHCGCGGKTKIAVRTYAKIGEVKGEPRRYIKGHNGRLPADAGEVGYCACGCGQQTTIAKRTYSSESARKGRPMKYVRGHNRGSGPVSPDLYVVDANGCWIWQRAKDGKGYGQIRVDGRLIPAHRYMYETKVGPIPAGLELDHLCRVPLCINPEHLEPVTHAENVRRAAPYRGARAS